METWVRRASGGQSFLGESYFQVAVAFGVVTLFAASAIHLEVSTPLPSPCDFPPRCLEHDQGPATRSATGLCSTQWHRPPILH